VCRVCCIPFAPLLQSKACHNVDLSEVGFDAGMRHKKGVVAMHGTLNNIDQHPECARNLCRYIFLALDGIAFAICKG
jgi:hypothetical protein